MELAGDISGAAIALVLMAAGFWKLGRAKELSDAWERHGVLPSGLLRVAAPVIAPMELALAAAVIVPPARPIGASAAAALFGAYMLYLGAAARRRAEGGCACFGSDSTERINVAHVLRAGAMSVLAVIAAVGGSDAVYPGRLVVGLALGAALIGGGSVLIALVDVATRRRSAQLGAS